MKLEINIKVSEPVEKYFYIYEVYVKDADGNNYVITRKLSEEDAEETAKLFRDLHESRYKTAFVISQPVFIK